MKAAISVYIILIVLFFSALGLGAADALTTYISLPPLVNALVWLAAGGYALIVIAAGLIQLAAVNSQDLF